MIALAGWRRFWEERKAHAATLAAYNAAVAALHVEEQRAVRVAFLLTDGRCSCCDVLTEERDAAIYDAEGLRLALDAEIATRVWLEAVGFGRAKGDVPS